MRTTEENEAFGKALGVMADVYASAVGTTVLQLKEIPPRPKDHDGALCLFGLYDGVYEPAIRAALGDFGDIETVEFPPASGMAIVRFASHAAALAAKQAPLPEGLCETLDFLYNERSYDGRRNDDEGRSDDDGRGWCCFEDSVSGELVARLTTYPRMQQALASLPPKMLNLASSRSPQVIELKGDLAARIDTVKARLTEAKFTGKGDKATVPKMYEDYVKRIAEVLQSTLALAGVEAAELTLPVAPTVEAPNAPALRLADGQLLLCLPDVDGRAAGGEGATLIGAVRDEHIELLFGGSDAKLVVDSCSQVVLPWRPRTDPERWVAAFQLAVKKLIDLKEHFAGFRRLKLSPLSEAQQPLSEAQQKQALEHRLGVERVEPLLDYIKVFPLDEDGQRVAANPLMLSLIASVYEELRQGVEMPETVAELYLNVTSMLQRPSILDEVNVITTEVEALLATLPGNNKRDVEQFIEMKALRNAIKGLKEQLDDIDTAVAENDDTHSAHQVDSTLMERMMAKVDLSELQRCASDTQSRLGGAAAKVKKLVASSRFFTSARLLEVKKLVDLKERALSLNEDVKQVEELAEKVKKAKVQEATAAAEPEAAAKAEKATEVLRQELEAQVENVKASLEALLPVFEDLEIKCRAEETIEMKALREAVESTLEAVRSKDQKVLQGLLERQLDELKKAATKTESQSHPETLAAHLFRATGAVGERRYASGQMLTVRQPDGQWSDACVSIAGVPPHVAGQELPLHPWNHAPRELPRADFETLRLWWMQTLRLQHSQMTDALTGNRLDVMKQCVAINMVGADSGDIREARSLSEWLCARYTDLCQGGVVDTPTATALLTGPPAAGKTSLMSQVIVHSLDAELVPVFIKVQRLQRSLLDHPEAFGKAWNWVDAYLWLEHQDQPTVYHFLRQALLGRRVLLVLDGLDEGGIKRSEIERHVTEVLAPQGHVMLCSSRPAGLNAERFAGFRRLELSPLREDQQEQALRQRLGVDCAGVDRAGDLLEYLKTLPLDETGQRVTANPLMLSMVASVYEIRQGFEMPETVAELYNVASEAMLARGGASSPELRKLLQAVFFEAHMSQQREVSESLLEEAARKAGISNKVLDEFRSRAMLDKLPLISLLTTEPLTLQSSHLSFQEYFAAHALCKQGTRNERLPQIPPWQWPAWWGNTLTIGEGMGKNFWKGMGENFWKGLLCAAGLLESGALDLSGGRLDAARLDAGDRPMALRAVHAQLPALSELNLEGNTISDAEAVAIGGALRVNAVLVSLNLRNNRIGLDGAVAIAGALTVNGSLTSLRLDSNGIGATGSVVIGEALKVNGSLTELNLDGFALPVKKLKGTEPVEQLNLSEQGLSVASAVVIASLIGVNGSLTSLNISSNRICGLFVERGSPLIKGTYTADGIKAICDALLASGSLTSLNISNNQICGLDNYGNGTYTDEGINAICNALCVNSSLTELNLDGCALPVKKLKGTEPVEQLDLSEQGLSVASAVVIASLIGVNGSLTLLNLNGNRIHDTGGVAIAEALKINDSLTELGLSWSSIGEAGASALAEALKVNNSLRSLDLEHNHVGRKGGAAFAEALNVNGLLIRLSLYGNNIVTEGSAAEAERIMIMRRLHGLNLL